MPTWQPYLDQNQPRFLAELSELLRYPTIGTLREHGPDLHACAAWLAQRLTAAGLEHARPIETAWAPIVYADRLHATGKPTVLIYGHYDVQPVDPLELWTTPPFEPTIRDGCLYARGATDDKGPTFACITAVEAILQTAGALPCNVKFLLEGEEEYGSPSAPEAIRANRDLFACDVAWSCDGVQYSETQPQLSLGSRGLLAMRLEVDGPRADVHSGLYGGSIANPLHALVEILASLHHSDGTIAVPGYYDDVRELSAEERARLARAPFDEQGYLQMLGAPKVFGAPGYSTNERLWIRPTLEINGVCGGFTGEGVKTVLPAHAWANLTSRLVPDQDPAIEFEKIRRHVEAHSPDNVTVTLDRLPGGAYPYEIAPDDPSTNVVRDVLTALYGVAPYEVRGGGTLPMLGVLLREAGIRMAGFGFTTPDEAFHAPNEFLRLASFRRAQKGYAMALERVGTGRM